MLRILRLRVMEFFKGNTLLRRENPGDATKLRKQQGVFCGVEMIWEWTYFERKCNRLRRTHILTVGRP